MLEILKQIALLSDVDLELLEKHVNENHIYIRNYRKGDTLHSQNDACSTTGLCAFRQSCCLFSC